MSRRNDTMSTRIVKDFTIDAAVHFENKFMITPFDMKLFMDVETDSVREQNVAIERTNYFLQYHLDSCIFVDSKLTDAISKYEQAGIRVVEMPEEPYDQIVGIVLLLKLNSIMEDRLIITDCVFGSKLSTGIKFDLAVEQAKESFHGKFWWNDPSLSLTNRTLNKKDKVVKLFDIGKWDQIGLSWKEKAS